MLQKDYKLPVHLEVASLQSYESQALLLFRFK